MFGGGFQEKLRLGSFVYLNLNICMCVCVCIYSMCYIYSVYMCGVYICMCVYVHFSPQGGE